MSSPLVLPLWTGPAPHSKGDTPNDIPTLTVFLPEKTDGPTSALIVCPGGGYAALAGDYEGAHNARWFRDRGVAAFVLHYRLPSNGYRHPVPLLDVQRAVRLVRSRATEWNINPDKVGIMGFSAGGHLCSTLATHFDAGDLQAPDPIDRLGCRPDFAVLVYPVITMDDKLTHGGSKAHLLGPGPDADLVASLSNETQVTPQTPPTVLIHSLDDLAVPIDNSRLMFAALQKAGVPAVLHEYPTGSHGFGYLPEPEKNKVVGWLDKACAWLKSQGWVP